MHGSNHSNCLFDLSLTIEDEVTFLKNDNVPDDINTVFWFSFFVVIERICLLSVFRHGL